MKEGNELKCIINFMLPLLVGNIFQQLYTFVDSMVVGRFVGATALGSVGAVASIVNLFFALCVGLSGGVNVMVAQYFGAEKFSKVKQSIGNSIYAALISGIAMGVIGLGFSGIILESMKIPAENMADALMYMRIVCGAMVVTSAYNMISQVMRALGDAKTPLYYMMLSSVLNVVLDLVFVQCFHWGVAGVAWATVIAQLVVTVGAVWSAVTKNAFFKLNREDLRPRKSMFQKILWMGIPLAAQNAMGSISGVVSQRVVNSFGSGVMAAFTASCRVQELFLMPYGTLGVAVSTFAAQNLGANQYDRIKKGCKKTVLVVAGYSVIVLLLSLLCGRQIVGMFIEQADLITLANRGLIIFTSAFFVKGTIYIFKAMLNGVGDVSFAMWNGVIEVAAQIIFINLLTQPFAFGKWGIWYANWITSLVASLICILRYRSGKWKMKGVA